MRYDALAKSIQIYNNLQMNANLVKDILIWWQHFDVSKVHGAKKKVKKRAWASTTA